MKKKCALVFSFLLIGSIFTGLGIPFPGKVKPLVRKINPATFNFSKLLTLSKNEVVEFFVNGVGANPAVANKYDYDEQYFKGEMVTEKQVSKKGNKKLLGGKQYLKLKALKSTGNGMTSITVESPGKSKKTIHVIIN